MSRRQTFAGSESRAEARASSQPITAHRLFPALVALWFAALFGLGSFVVPASLLERAIGAVRLSAILPAAAPPLGLTARLLIAGAMTALGMVAGLMLALRLRPRPAEVVRRRGTVARTSEDSVDAEPVRAQEAAEPIDDQFDAPQVRAFDAHPDAPPRKPFVVSDDLVLGDVAIGHEDATEFTASPSWEPVETFASQCDDVDVGCAAIAEEVIEEAEWAVFEAEDRHVAEVVAEVAPKPFVSTVSHLRGSAIADAPLDSLGLVQLVERLALAIEGRRKATGDHGHPAPVEPVAPVVEDVAPTQPLVDPWHETAVEAPEPRQMFIVPEAEPDALEPSFEPETAEAGDLAAIEPAEEVVPEPEAVPPAVAVREPAPIPRLFGSADAPVQPPRILTARWDDAEGADDADEVDDIVVPRFLGRGLAGDSAGALGSGAEPAVATPRSEPRQEFIRDHAVSDDVAEAGPEAVVVFPGQGPRLMPVATEPMPPLADPGDAEMTERALRSALATLQRMTARG